MKVSVGVPVYQGSAWLAGALDGLLAQTLADVEVLVADNGSTDGSLDLAREYARRDPRVRVLTSDTNRGAAWNYNRLREQARGEYFKWAACDDRCEPALLERCVAVLDAHPEVCLAYPQTRLIDDQGRVIEDYEDGLHLDDPSPSRRFRRVVRDVRLCNAVFGVIRRSTLKETKGIGPYPSSDLVLLGELALRGRFHEVPGRLFLRRMHAQQSVQRHPENRQRGAWFDPARAGRRAFPAWRLWREFARAVARGPVRGRERWRCYLALGWWLRNKYGDLAQDLWRLGR